MKDGTVLWSRRQWSWTHSLYTKDGGKELWVGITNDEGQCYVQYGTHFRIDEKEAGNLAIALLNYVGASSLLDTVWKGRR